MARRNLLPPVQIVADVMKISWRMAAPLVCSGWWGAGVLPVARRSQPRVQGLPENQRVRDIRLVALSSPRISTPGRSDQSFESCSPFWFPVSQTDTLRLDLNLPGELHYYLRASTSQERQQWLVALGSAKACEGITKETPEPGTPSAEQAAGSITFHAVRPSAGAIEGDKDLLKTKRSELRLYCDLLMQQVHSVKDAATQMPKPDVDVNIPSHSAARFQKINCYTYEYCYNRLIIDLLYI